MPANRGVNQARPRSRSRETTPVADPGRTEDVLIRNYDHERGYDLRLTVRARTDETTFRNRYYLQPGEIVSECDQLPSGDYEVAVTLDDRQESSDTHRIDSSADHTVVIEIGNGALSLTEGLYS
jgi:hypothetical protein